MSGARGFTRIVGCDPAGISSVAAKSAVTVFEPRGSGFELVQVKLLPPADRTLRPDREFLDSVGDSDLLVVDSPLQWPSLLRMPTDADTVERHWIGRLAQALKSRHPKERFSLVRDRLCEKCVLMNGVPVNNPGANLGGVVARAIHWRNQLAGRATIIETNPDSVLAHVGVLQRDGDHRWYRPREHLRGVIRLSAFLQEEAIVTQWPNVHLRPGADRDLRAYASDGKAGPDKDLLMAVAAGLCGVSYAMNSVVLPCTARSREDIGEPFASDGWIYLPLRDDDSVLCCECVRSDEREGDWR